MRPGEPIAGVGAKGGALREEVRQYKRTRIVEEASRLFFAQGYELTNVDDIAARLGISKPVIYGLFPNKLAILQAIYESSARRLLEKVRTELEKEGSAAERLRSVIHTFVLENIDNQVSSGVFLREEKHLSADQLAASRDVESSFDRLLADLVEAGIAAGEFSARDSRLASFAISGMVRWVHRWYRPDGRLDRMEIAAEMAELGLNLVGCRAARTS